MNARKAILDRLRHNLARQDLRFPPAYPVPLAAEERMVVTQDPGLATEDRRAWAERFGRELETLHGSFEWIDTVAEARMALFSRLLMWLEEEQSQRKVKKPDTTHDRKVLCWHPSQLPLPDLEPAMRDVGFQFVVPEDMHDPSNREAAHVARMGVTGVDAAFVTTGSLLMVPGPGKSRAASLLPLRHLVLIPLSRLYLTLEDWLAEQRRQGRLVDLMREHGQLSLITGPSKSADIEGNLTLGVHGPRQVHAILFDDSELGS
jgi:L-lactate dehydrogenase complex protein LldG